MTVKVFIYKSRDTAGVPVGRRVIAHAVQCPTDNHRMVSLQLNRITIDRGASA